MFSILLFACILTCGYCMDITNNTAPDYLGEYKLVFTWPKPRQQVPNCSFAKYSYFEYQGPIPSMTCDCGRKDAQLVLMKQNTKFVGMPVLFDVVGTFDEATRALDDSCRCKPFYFGRVVALKINDNLMLQYEQEAILRHYIFAKVMPSETELREVISTLRDLKCEDGELVCK